VNEREIIRRIFESSSTAAGLAIGAMKTAFDQLDSVAVRQKQEIEELKDRLKSKKERRK